MLIGILYHNEMSFTVVIECFESGTPKWAFNKESVRSLASGDAGLLKDRNAVRIVARMAFQTMFPFFILPTYIFIDDDSADHFIFLSCLYFSATIGTQHGFKFRCSNGLVRKIQ